MSDPDVRIGSEPLQFDRVTESGASSADPGRVAVECSGCHASIETEYYEINGRVFCGRCRTAVESLADTPQDVRAFVVAALLGLGAGIVGAAIYFAVIAVAHLEIGIVAILIGYMVGYSVRRGARGRGGLRFQVLAVALTYLSIALAYAPLALKGAADRRNAQRHAAPQTAGGDRSGVTAAVAPAAGGPAGSQSVAGLLLLLALIIALPILTIVGSFPSGLISAVIIFVGLRQAWRMTRAPMLNVFGPYRVGTALVSAPA